jgi:hypothetical protein
MHDKNYKYLASITFKNKQKYCEKHNYPLLLKTDNWKPIPMGFEKAYLIKEALQQYPECKWVFFSECDTFITNMNIKLEDIIENEQNHAVLTTDGNGINSGSFFIRNSPEGINYLNEIINNIGKFNHEQDFFQHCYNSNNYKNIISVYPQRMFNSYIYNCRQYTSMPHCYTKNFNLGLDYFGNNGSWEKGDFMFHLPGMSLDDRIIILDKYNMENNKKSIVFFTWITDDYKNSIVDFDNFYKSFKYFHPDIDLKVFGQDEINKLFNEKKWLYSDNCKASFAKLLYNDYDLVVNIDSDFYIFDRLDEIIKGDYEIAACANYNSCMNVELNKQSVNGIDINYVSKENYIQGGLIASTSKKFWDDYEDLSKKLSKNLPLRENDVLNILFYNGNYKTKILDGDCNFNSTNFKQYYNCASLSRENNVIVLNDKLYLDGKPVKSYHVARGSGRKLRMHQLFSNDVNNWFFSKIL